MCVRVCECVCVLPLLLLDRLLSEGHVLHVLLQPVERGVWLHPDPVVVVLGIPSETHSSTGVNPAATQAHLELRGQHRR